MNRLKPIIFIVTILLLAVTIFSYVFFDNIFLIRKYNLPLDPPGFLDSRQFAWASEAYAQGFDPLVENPVNPRGHQLNYPRIWHVFFALGIDESHTNIIGTIVVILFIVGIGIFWFSRKFNDLTYLVLPVMSLSPAVMLGVERSNIELIIFFVLSVALLINYHSRISALFIFIFAAVLKIYPVFGFIYLLKENQRRFWTLLLSSLAIFILYGILSFNDFMQVYQTTPKLVNSSFGIHVWWMGLRNGRLFGIPLSESSVTFFTALSYIIALIILMAALALSKIKKSSGIYREGNHLDAFRVGAGIYVGCFLLMNTHDYRLIFLIFTIPQLIEWLLNKEKGYLMAPLITLSAMFVSLWSFFIMRFLGRKLTFVFEEFSNWVILTGLLYLLISSLPEWFSGYLRLQSGKQKIS